MSKDIWKPTASIENLKKRAQLLNQLRSFFMQRDVMEVDVPVLSPYAVSDLNLEPISALVSRFGNTEQYFLNTSPEFYMKRLLAAGCESIFYLGKAFRQEECGRHHYYEFTMLEWYRLAWDLPQLINEVVELITEVLPGKSSSRVRYQDLFQRFLEIDINSIDDSGLLEICKSKLDLHSDELSRNDCLDLLFSTVIQPGLTGITVVEEYPVTMAALAKAGINDDGYPIAHRFEVFVESLELANGYWELSDVDEQRRRFDTDQQSRESLGREVRPLDKHFLSALEEGLPPCSGVALGVDRLLMTILQEDAVQSVLPFAD